MSTVPPPPFVIALSARMPELRETHISWVFLGPTEVVKIKKPVRFAFLDFSTLALRRAACEAEVALNRRLSPDVYIDVAKVALDDAGAPIIGGAGEPLDFAVRMRRLPDAERADVMFEAGRLNVGQVELLAEHIARFHQTTEIDRDPAGPGALMTLTTHVEENLAALASFGTEALGQQRWAELCARQRGSLAALSPLLIQRLADGRVRDGHGDLRLDHVYFGPDGAIRVLDCVEFDRAFRVADVCADVAFFAMNLYERGRADWAERFVARYARDAGDHDLYALLDFYLAYWALVRAKVCEARAEQTEGELANAQHAACARLLELAHAFVANEHKPARLCAVGGVIGSGKSRLAARIGAEWAVPVLQSDRLRKQQHGVDPERKLSVPGAYSEQATEDLYAELRRRAAVVLQSGRSVVVDASFRSQAERRTWARLAQELGARFVFFECHAPRPVLETRLRARERKNVVSDARIDLLDGFLARYEALGEGEFASAMRVDTARPPDEVWDSVRAHLWYDDHNAGAELTPRAASRPGQP